jgi:hypothetical protein
MITIKWFSRFNAKQLFLIDAVGALLTACLLLLLAGEWNRYIGMPKLVLNYLSVAAMIFSFYSISCYVLGKLHWTFYLRIICFANLLYCLTTGVLVVYHYRQLTWLGIGYFIAEIVIISFLVFVENRAIAQANQPSN